MAPTSSSGLWLSLAAPWGAAATPSRGREKAGRTTKERRGAAQKQGGRERPPGATATGSQAGQSPLCWRGGQASEKQSLVQRTQRLASDGVSASRVPLTPPPGPAGAPPPQEPPQATPWGPCFTPDSRNTVSLCPILGDKV